jgi:hypothetical protein
MCVNVFTLTHKTVVFHGGRIQKSVLILGALVLKAKNPAPLILSPVFSPILKGLDPG